MVVDKDLKQEMAWLKAETYVITASENVLILLNGHPLYSAYWGEATWMHDTLIIDNIKYD